MTYIWNRTDRVPEIHMPKAIEVAFKKWANKNNKDLNKAIKHNDLNLAKRIKNKMRHQSDNYSDAIRKYKINEKKVDK